MFNVLHSMSEKFLNQISVIYINSAIACTPKALCSRKSNDYVSKISTRLVKSVSRYIQLNSVHDTLYEFVNKTKKCKMFQRCVCFCSNNPILPEELNIGKDAVQTILTG